MYEIIKVHIGDRKKQAEQSFEKIYGEIAHLAEISCLKIERELTDEAGRIQYGEKHANTERWKSWQNVGSTRKMRNRTKRYLHQNDDEAT